MTPLTPFLAAAAIAARVPMAPPPPIDVQGRIEALAAANPALVELSQIGMSRSGRPLHLVRLGDEAGKPDEAPALLIVAGAAGNHRVGVEAALGVAEKLAAEHAEVLKGLTVFVVPCLNPDSLAFNAQMGEEGKPAFDYWRTISPFDADHDGRVNEDPGEDLNGDGSITMMRVANPPPGSGLRIDAAPDPENAKLTRRADAAKGEVAKYALLTEGIDNDGDGKFNEDGPGGTGGGGIDLDLNTPYRWPEFADGAGAYPLSEPESHALVRWVLDHRNVVAVLFYGPHDSLAKVPDAGKFDEAGGVPLGIETGDKAYYDEVSKAFKEITKMTAPPAAAVDNAGSLHGWTYAMGGVYTFSTPVWVRPDLLKAEKEEKKEDAKPDGDTPTSPTPAADPATPPAAERGGNRTPGGTPPPPAHSHDDEEDDEHSGFATQPAQPGGQPGGRRTGFPGGRGGAGAGGPPASGAASSSGEGSDDLKWLKYSDEKREGEGFVEWKEFDHPQLGKVEIGGFVPGFKVNPPDEELPRLVDEQTRFVAALLGKLPRLTEPAVVVKRLGPGLWRISVRTVNDGYLPIQPAIGAKARRVAPTRILIDLPQERIVSGDKIARYNTVGGSGGLGETEWIIKADDGSTVKIKYNPVAGAPREIEVKLEEAAR